MNRSKRRRRRQAPVEAAVAVHQLERKVLRNRFAALEALDEEQLEFIHNIRNKTGIEIPAIIVTADHSNEVEEKILELGLKLLHKPVKPAMLRATMNHELR